MPTELLNKISDFTTRNKFILIVLLLTFLARLPSLFEPFWYGDEAIYAVAGQKILRGGLMYVDVFDHKTPGIYYLTASALKIFGQTIWSLHFLLMLWVLVTLVFFFFLAKKLFNEKTAKIAVIVFAVLTATPFLEGNIFNSEILMILPVTIGLIFGLNKKYFWSGIFFSLALMLKFPAVFDFGAFVVFIALGTVRQNLKENFLNLVRLGLGYLVPIVLSVIYFAWKGAFGAYLFAALLFNFSYTNYGNQLVVGPLKIENGLIILKAVPLLALVIYFFWKLYLNLRNEKAKNPVSNLELVILWLAFAFYGAVFGGRPYPHYLIQVVPALSLVVALIFILEKRKIAASLTAVIVVLTLLLGFKPYIRPSYYPNFFRFVTGNIKEEDYLNSFDAKTSRNYALASFIDGCEKYQSSTCQKTRTTSADNIYIWGNSPVIYFLSQRDPTSKYITEFHVVGNENFKAEVNDSVKRRNPKYILVEQNSSDFPALDKILASQYNLFAQTDDVKIYQFLGSNPTD